MKKNKNLLYRGLTSTSAFLLIVALFGTNCALDYTGTINSMLHTSSSKIVDDGTSTEDTQYYKSKYGEMNADNLQKLIADTYQQSVNEESEGAVLLKNDNNTLPLQKNSRITLFGHAVVQPVYSPGGANSDAADDGQNVISLYDAMKSAGYAINDTLYQAYQKSATKRVASNSLTVPGGPKSDGKLAPPPQLGEEKASFYTQELQSSWADDYDDAAVIMLAREGGEDDEMMMKDPDGISSLALHQEEKDLLKMVQSSGKFSKIIVLLNSAYPMEVDTLKDYGVNACLWIGDPGIRGFEGVADIIDGSVNPSGRLTDTYAASSLSAPAVVNASQNTQQWSNVDDVLNSGIVTDAAANVSHTSVQAEGIYVGYKYYETRYEDAILNPASGAAAKVGATQGSSWQYQNEVTYPFGYGLSYTSFTQKLDNVQYDQKTDTYTANVTVTNIGSTAGKSAVELYAQTPYGDYEKQNLVEKSALQLVGYGKTDTLKPGASATVKITVDRYLLASYDYTKTKGYILSAGDYYFAVGDNAHDALNNILAAKNATGMVDQDGNSVTGDAAKTYQWNLASMDTTTYQDSAAGTKVTNQFADCDVNYWQPGTVTYLTRQNWADTYPVKATTVACTEDMMKILQGDTYTKPDNAPSVDSFTFSKNANLTLAAMKDVAYDDDATWNQYLDQMSLDELASQISDMFGTKEVESVGKPAFTEGDGTASVGESKYAEQYGDTRDVCLYPCSVVLAACWNQDLLQSRGEDMAEEAMYCNMPEFYTGGGDIHRTPFGGRNGEYYSEDSYVVYLDSAIELSAIQAKGIGAGIKHVAGNDQELYREGLAMFFNEQAFREGSLKAVEGVLSGDHTLVLMEAFNRLGLVWDSSSAALCTQVLRNEWGFKGQEETDGVVGSAYKNHFSTSLTAGATTYCIDPGQSSSTAIVKEIKENNDGYLLSKLRDAVKNYHYALSRTILVNGISADSKIVHVTPWWQGTLYAVDGVFGVLTLLFFVLFVTASRKKQSAVLTEDTVSGGDQNEK